MKHSSFVLCAALLCGTLSGARVVYNNDADDGVWWPRNLAPTAENFLARRVRTMEGSEVDTMFYVVQVSFGHTVYDSKIGGMIAANTQRPDVTVLNPQLAAKGLDQVQLALEETRRQGRTFFGSFRMNDVHDSWWAPGEKHKWVWLFGDFKRNHPELLFGSHENRPPFGQWSAVDYENETVRKTFAALFREACERYDFDGVELDFFRWPLVFKSVAWGTPASAGQREIFNGLMRELRKIADETGAKRGRKLEIAVRVPDSVGYCADLGLDIETWMREGLIDIMTGGGNMNLELPDVPAKLCRKYGVKYYASLDMPQFDEPRGYLFRDAPEVWSARSAAALHAGADGLYYFNVFTPQKVKNQMVGKPETLRNRDKRYFVTDVLIDLPETYLPGGAKHNGAARLSFREKTVLGGGETAGYELYLGDERAELDRARCRVLVKGEFPAGSKLTLMVNGREFPESGRGPTLAGFEIDSAVLKPGRNQVALRFDAAPGDAACFKTVLKGDQLLRRQNQPPWRRVFTAFDFAGSEAIENGGYRISDTGSGATDIANLLYPLTNLPTGKSVVRFSCRVQNADRFGAVALRVADGRNVEIVEFMPDEVRLRNAGKTVRFTTTDAFHDYELKLEPGKAELFADGKLLISGGTPVAAGTPAGDMTGYTYLVKDMQTRSLSLGSLSGPGVGSALWRDVAVQTRSDAAVLSDLALDVRLSAEPLPKRNVNAVDAVIDRRDGEVLVALSDGNETLGVRLDGDGATSENGEIFGIALPAPQRSETLRVELNGTQLSVFVDGKRLFFRDRSMTPAEFLQTNASLFSDAEQKTLRRGGAVVRGAVSDVKTEFHFPDPAEMDALAAKAGTCGKTAIALGDARLHSAYAPGNSRSSGDGVALNHNDPAKQFQLVRLNSAAEILRKPGIFTGVVELSQTEAPAAGEALFNFCVARVVDDSGAVREFVWKLYPGRLVVPGVGECKLPPATRRKIAFAFDAKNGLCVVETGGVRVAGKIAAGTGNPQLWFGDGSKTTSGALVLHDLKFDLLDN